MSLARAFDAKAPAVTSARGPRPSEPVPSHGGLPLQKAAPARAAPGARSPEPKRSATATQPKGGKEKRNVLEEIEKLRLGRENRRRVMEEAKRHRAEEELRMEANGRPGDVDYRRMVLDFRAELPTPEPARDLSGARFCVAVRKRPIGPKEIEQREIDTLTAHPPDKVYVHECRFRVDGVTKELQNHAWGFDASFDDADDTAEVYLRMGQGVIPTLLQQDGRATIVAYGQTGSGKTFTMVGIQGMVVEDIFRLLEARGDPELSVTCSMFEIYQGRLLDLLNNRTRCEVLEDGNGQVTISGVQERTARSSRELWQTIEYGNALRTTCATASNLDSSRSHSVCEVNIRRGPNGDLVGKLSLVDLAGSERASQSAGPKSVVDPTGERHNEGAQINQSLLALKECIRAMSSNAKHVPFRQSKLTMVLRDSFTSKNAQLRLIVCLSPGISSADHSLNSLRYAASFQEAKAQAALRQDKAAAGPVRTSTGGDDEGPGDVTARGKPRPARHSDPPRPQTTRPAAAGSGARRARSPEAAFQPPPRKSAEGLRSSREAAPEPASARGNREEPLPAPPPRTPAPAPAPVAAPAPPAKTSPGVKASSPAPAKPAGSAGVLAVLHGHMQAVEEDAGLLHRESELLSALEQRGTQDGASVDEYAREARAIVARKLELYQALAGQLDALQRPR